MDWRDRASVSHYQTAVAIGHELKAGHLDEAEAGLQELIDALSRSEKRALRSQLIRLMAHVIKWETQPERRPRSWSASINAARAEIRSIQEETPSLSDEVIRQMWGPCFALAKEQAEGEMDRESPITALTWDQVFAQTYRP